MRHGSFEIEWSDAASNDLDAIVAFIHRDPLAALRVLNRIETRAAALLAHPLRGRVVPELAAFQIRIYRELLISPYRLIYRIAESRVVVLGVFDGRRNLEDILLERFLAGSGTGS